MGGSGRGMEGAAYVRRRRDVYGVGGLNPLAREILDIIFTVISIPVSVCVI